MNFFKISSVRRWTFRPLLTLLLLSPCVLCRGDADSKDEVLRGASGVYVVIEEINPAQNLGSRVLTKHQVTTENLRSDVELVLKNAGVKVVGRDIWSKDPDTIELYVNVNGVEIEDMKGRDLDIMSFNINVQVYELCSLDRNPQKKKLAVTWSVGSTGFVGGDKVDSIRDIVIDHARAFAAAFIRETEMK